MVHLDAGIRLEEQDVLIAQLKADKEDLSKQIECLNEGWYEDTFHCANSVLLKAVLEVSCG